jgi:hypothetical protein
MHVQVGRGRQGLPISPVPEAGWSDVIDGIYIIKYINQRKP